MVWVNYGGALEVALELGGHLDNNPIDQVYKHSTRPHQKASENLIRSPQMRLGTYPVI